MSHPGLDRVPGTGCLRARGLGFQREQDSRATGSQARAGLFGEARAPQSVGHLRGQEGPGHGVRSEGSAAWGRGGTSAGLGDFIG